MKNVLMKNEKFEESSRKIERFFGYKELRIKNGVPEKS
jgi:hypothetical protein